MQNTTKQAVYNNFASVPWVDQPSSALVIIQLINAVYAEFAIAAAIVGAAHGVFID
jgi:hypothetical protein